MKTTPGRPLPYRLSRQTERGAAVVIQTREIVTGKLIQADRLEAYAVKKAISSPWGMIRAGSRLLLVPDAARFLLASGGVETMPEEIL